jgi:putative MATE family efflux protein
MNDGCDYMQIICMGTIFVFGYNAVCSLMKGFGDSKSPLYFVAVATIVNIVLDLLLVGPLGMGTKGAAYATIFSQGVSLLISIFHLKRKNFIFDFKLKSFAIQKEKLIVILKVGLPTAIQMLVVNISYLLITGMLNTFGVSVAAASGIGLKVNTFAGMPCWAVGQAVTAMVGQNMGAQNIERVKKTTKSGLLINVCVTLIAVVLVQLFSENVIMLFDPVGTDVIKEGVLYLRICCSINSLVYAVMYTLHSFAIGIGSANVAMCNALLDAVVVRLPICGCWHLSFKWDLHRPGGFSCSTRDCSVVYFTIKKWSLK